MGDKHMYEFDMTEREKAYADFQKAWDEFKTAIFEYLHLERLEKWLGI